MSEQASVTPQNEHTSIDLTDTFLVKDSALESVPAIENVNGELANLNGDSGVGTLEASDTSTAIHEKPDEKSTESTPGKGVELVVATTDESKLLSKKAMKRQRRWEQKLEVKKRKKEHEREAKRAKAELEGRDLEEERRERDRRAQVGEGHARREKLLMDRIRASADRSFQVCLDCAFEEQMTYKEINSLSLQIRYCYAGNKRAHNPVYLTVTSLAGTTRSILEKVDGFPDNWIGRGFNCNEKPMEEILDKSKLVYLTSDSSNVLQEPQNDKIYVIGGIVDRNRLQRATIDRADSLGIPHAKLPLEDHLQLFSTKVLTCNHVFEILLKYRDCHNDWKKAMLEVLPERKDFKEK